MSPLSPRPRAVVLAVALLPLCVVAAPLRLELARCESAITDLPGLTTKVLEERVTHGLTQVTRLEPQKAVLVPAGALEGADLRVEASLERKGDRFRLVFELQTKQTPQLSKRLAYEFKNPQLGERGVMVMAGELVAEAVELEERRKIQARAPPAVVAEPAAVGTDRAGSAAPVPGPPQPVPSTTLEDEGDGDEGDAPRASGRRTRLDVGLGAGVNTPSGVFGVELEFRPIQWLGFQVAGGTGEWGYRVSPLLRVYPLGRGRFSPFLEGGASFNLGNEATVTDSDGAARTLELLFTPVAVVSVGVRGTLGQHAFFTPRVGWGRRLRQGNIRASDGGAIDPNAELVSDLEQQEGLLFGLSAGVSFM
ncbi:hypothetical protein [Hyalangium gracile]|uniref:hypothetical protein n=1 Tax=Hyalangium gracile TaxID=394092 RepID=UPI001CD00C12|nr:hypothetical protein [Hyalangium gracile]